MTGALQTQDIDIVIEERRIGCVRYRRLSTGARWEVHGVCTGRGDCIVGSVLADGTLVRTHEHLGRLKDERGSDFLECMYPLDSPFTPEGVRKGLCCPLTVVELEPA